MPAPLVARQEPIARIFSDDYVFTIPPFQRPYAWGKEQTRDLIEDLLGFLRVSWTEIDNVPPYFLGSIVLIKDENEPDADVVDGQQRLTTLTILLSVIRANVIARDAGDITTRIYEEGSRILKTKDRFRLSLRDRDREFFQTYVQRSDGLRKLLMLGDALSDSQRNIRDNARLLDNVVKTLTEDQRIALVQFILTKCHLARISQTREVHRG
jgi:hypothetical protein